MTVQKMRLVLFVVLPLAAATWACGPSVGELEQAAQQAEALATQAEESGVIETLNAMDVETTEEAPPPAPAPNQEAPPAAGDSAAPSGPSLPLETHCNDFAGQCIGLPTGWEVDDFTYITRAAPNLALTEQDDVQSPAVVAIAGPRADLMPSATAPEDLFEHESMEDFPRTPGDGVTVGEVEHFTVGGYPGAAMIVSVTNDPLSPTPYTYRLVTALGPDKVGISFGIAPTAEWDAFRPTYDAIIASWTFTP